MASIVAEHQIPEETPILYLDANAAFDKLTLDEKKYAHYLSVASWAGRRIVLRQCSDESETIFDFILATFKTGSYSELNKAALEKGVTAEVWSQFVQYAAVFLGNLGNYKSFGDQKFIPRCSKDQFQAVANAIGNDQSNALLAKVLDKIFSLEENERELGLNDSGKGLSSYYSRNVNKPEIELVQELMNEKHIGGYNTRLFKLEDGTLELRLASAETGLVGSYTHKDRKVNVVKGDYSADMKEIVANLEKALPHAANDHQRDTLKHYIAHFTTGDLDEHKKSQRSWIQDKGPVVESNIGFIESYRDPFGVRGEWEGFVSIVNKEVSAKFNDLVAGAEKFIAQLPWPKQYEKDKFLKPDFTSLEVITFGTSGVPAGINLPNYDDIRQDFGFKNVSLGNVLSAMKMTDRVTFLKDADQDLFKDYLTKAFEVQVGIHELLGHGSGKTFVEQSDGSLNFDKQTINPLTGKPIESWYKPGQTYDSQFLGLGSAMEECRAESVGIYLCTEAPLLKVFGFTGDEATKVVYINWLNMVRAGLLGLEFYSPDTKKWRQAHMQARFSILSVLLEASQGNDFVTITSTGNDIVIALDKTKIESVGKPAIAQFLQQMQVFKATADVSSAEKLFEKYSGVTDKFAQHRAIVIGQKKPRRIFVQGRTVLNASSNSVELKAFPATPEGMIASFLH